MTVEEKEEVLSFIHNIVDNSTISYDPFNNEQDIMEDISRIEENILELKSSIEDKNKYLDEIRKRKLMAQRAKQLLKDMV